MIQIVTKNEGKETAGLVAEIFSLLTNVYQESPWSKEQLEEEIQSKLTHCYLAYEQLELVGFFAFQETDFEVDIEQIAVLPAYRKRGIASALFAYLPKGKEIFLEVRASNQPAIRFYQKAGFREVGRRRGYYQAPLEDAIMMKRERNEG